MEQLDSNDKKALGTALLGLRGGKSGGAPVGAPPTVEEFGALYEGSLDDTRRAQVLSHIAADPEVYRAWIEVASAQSTLIESLESTERPETAGESLLGRLGSWVRESFAIPVGAGAFAAAALVAVLIIPGEEPGEALSEIDRMYGEYGTQWQVSPGTLYDREVRGTSSTSVSGEEQALYEGLRQGLDQLGDEFPQKWLAPVEVDAQVESLAPELRAALTDMGRLATLARFQCQLEGSAAFFASAEQSMDRLAGKLELSDSRLTVKLAKAIDQPGEPAERVCDFSREVVASLSAK